MRTYTRTAICEARFSSFRFIIEPMFFLSTLILLASSTCVAATSATPLATATAAARIADQTTFGPTPALIEHIQQIGLSAYVTEQLNEPSFIMPAAATAPYPAYCGQQYNCSILPWTKDILLGNDQLRQRVALALSEMFTVSFNDVTPAGLPTYQNILTTNAFGNYQTLMKQITLNTAMGEFLNMAGNAKPLAGNIADENYARELMQLMSIGTCRLNIQGICQTYGGVPISVYDGEQVQALARALTGWWPASGRDNYADMVHPMIPVESKHDTGSKSLIDNVTLPAGQTAEEDLDGALAAIFADSNVPPFVSKALIQHLVTSNPSPEYVARVATVFENDGKGVRGNLAAVVKAILLDSEARAGDTAPATISGHLREPMLWLTGILRGLGAVPVSNNMADYGILNLSTLGQVPFRPDTVFSFYSPSYALPDTNIMVAGSIAVGPEFQLETTSHVSNELSIANAIIYNQYAAPVQVNFAPSTLLGKAVASGPGPLVDQLGSIFLHSQVPPQMKSAIVSFITPMKKPTDQIANAAYLIITSPQYKVVN